MFKVSPPLSGASEKIHSIKCAKLLTSTVAVNCCGEDKKKHLICGTSIVPVFIFANFVELQICVNIKCSKFEQPALQ